jgi:hypothetical protein
MNNCATQSLARRSLDPNVVKLRAESPIINSIGQRPMNGIHHIYQALKRSST